MECVEEKGGLKAEMVVSKEGVYDDLGGGQNGQTTDDFSVDDLLDFSNHPSHVDEHQVQQDHHQQQDSNNNNNVEENHTPNHFTLTDDFAPIPLPVDDMENLEWLSHFVEDSFSEHSLSYDDDSAGKLPKITTAPEESRSEPEKTPFTTPVQTKARTKRARAGMRVWSSPLTESSSSSSSSSSSTTTSSSAATWVVYSDPVQSQTAESVKPPPTKKQKRRAGSELSGAQQARRCSHCGVQKTPQWRAGPLGAKTLCNACGVRFKSGRLLPEYRPACSPTFSSELHSNNHRKVLEMRRKKELDAGLSTPPVQSF